MIVLLVIVSEMKVDTFKQKLQQVIELGGNKSVAAFALSLMFNVFGMSDNCKHSHCAHVSIRSLKRCIGAWQELH